MLQSALGNGLARVGGLAAAGPASVPCVGEGVDTLRMADIHTATAAVAIFSHAVTGRGKVVVCR